MNINLASRVVGYRIDAYGVEQYNRLQDDQNTPLSDIEGIEDKISNSLVDSGIKTVSDLMDADEESLVDLKGITSEKLDNVYSMVQAFIEREVEEVKLADENFDGSLDLAKDEEE